jgi:hypothetical protein
MWIRSKLKKNPHKNDAIAESLKSIEVTMDESRKGIERFRAKCEFLEKALTPEFYQ